MELFKESLTLCEIEKILEELIQNRPRNIRILGDLNLPKEDYRYLAFKVKSLVQHQSNMELAKKYKYSILFYLVFSYHYENEDKNVTKQLRHFFGKLQQYQLRQFIEILTEAFIECGFDIYGLDRNTMETFTSLILIHVGLLERFSNDFFLTMNDSIRYIDIKSYEKAIFKKLPPSMTKIYQLIDKDNFHKLFTEVREMLINCKVHNLNTSELFERHPYISGKLIIMCVEWCKRMEAMGEMHNKKA